MPYLTKEINPVFRLAFFQSNNFYTSVNNSIIILYNQMVGLNY